MVRLTRAEQQHRTRHKVLDAAKAEFTERGFRGATVDGIAERAELTRGAVYSNFPGKRALYLAVLAREADHAPMPSGHRSARTPAAALEAFAGVWTQQIPHTTGYERRGSTALRSPALGVDLLPEIMTDERLRGTFTQLLRLDAILLGQALESLGGKGSPPLSDHIDIAESALTILYGATQLAFAAPEFINAAQVTSLCGQVAKHDRRRSAVPRDPLRHSAAYYVDERWKPPACTDLVRARPARFDRRSITAILGTHKLAAVADALAIAPRDTGVTVAIVTADIDELAPLARLAVLDVSRSLRHAFPSAALSRLQVIVDESAALAAACGVASVDDDTEAAVVTTRGRVIARAEGPGGCCAAAVAAGRSVDGVAPSDDSGVATRLPLRAGRRRNRLVAE
ncbi:TetR/AcrR family transcriptional regulator [Nocardia terpenica]|uniref:TetR family transcriptional regulator n=1 Tax=Nocardia terpenica TaxID=455432 RepID=A0A6G9ZCP3_9NOCA|nr:TetR/AcrR family transcriptional regulator [Nocardia terpenica]QIS23389.1 TetR family transcriptional regulator [Nocardia terpenica]